MKFSALPKKIWPVLLLLVIALAALATWRALHRAKATAIGAAQQEETERTVAKLRPYASFTIQSEQRPFRYIASRSSRESPRRANDQCVARLARIPTLERVSLAYQTEVTDFGLALLTPLTNLTVLTVESPKVTDEGLKHLASLRNLEYLSLDCPNVTDEGLKHLAALEQLEGLSFRNMTITGEGFAHLTHLRKLKSLNFWFSKVTDAGLVHIGTFRQLEHLHLNASSITDDGLPHLTELKDLESLEMQSTKATWLGAARLKKALPDCRISFPFQNSP